MHVAVTHATFERGRCGESGVFYIERLIERALVAACVCFVIKQIEAALPAPYNVIVVVAPAHARADGYFAKQLIVAVVHGKTAFLYELRKRLRNLADVLVCIGMIEVNVGDYGYVGLKE